MLALNVSFNSISELYIIDIPFNVFPNVPGVNTTFKSTDAPDGIIFFEIVVFVQDLHPSTIVLITASCSETLYIL